MTSLTNVRSTDEHQSATIIFQPYAYLTGLAISTSEREKSKVRRSSGLTPTACRRNAENASLVSVALSVIALLNKAGPEIRAYVELCEG